MLLTLGFAPTTPEGDPEGYATLFRVARRLRDSGHRTVGLMPANHQTEVMAPALNLALALGDATGKTVAYFDANARAPALAALEGQGEMIESYLVVPLSQRLVAVTPRLEARSGARDAPLIERVLRETARRFDYVLADFTGLDRAGEHRWAYDLVDAVALVARSKRTREQEIAVRHGEIPPERDLGVLIVD